MRNLMTLVCELLGKLSAETREHKGAQTGKEKDRKKRENKNGMAGRKEKRKGKGSQAKTGWRVERHTPSLVLQDIPCRGRIRTSVGVFLPS